MQNTNQEKIKNLELKINQARKDYYNGQSQVSDQLYDSWIDELSLLDPKNFAVIGIGSEPISNWEKYTHLSPMGSLNKCQTFEEFQTWYHKYAPNKEELFLTLKLDGISVSLIYENGNLTKASSRGSGVVGELITSNVARMIGVPLKLKDKINTTIRGEILLSKENHHKYFPEYSNCRNAASGISRRYDGEGSDKLNVIVYNMISDDVDFKTHSEMFKVLSDYGFHTPTFYVLASENDVDSYKNKYQSSLRDQYEFDLDGLVIHINNLELHSSFGSHNQRDYASIAYKFDSIAKKGFVESIQHQVGNSGRITPVAIFNPKIELMGAEVEKASLHNYANISRLGIDVGAIVLVCRSNDVIPFVEEVVVSTGTTLQAPTNCPVCNSSLIQSGEYVQCPNTTSCPAQVSGRIKIWIKDLDILEWGEKLIDRLVENKKVTTIADLYSLTVEDLSKIDRMGKKSAQKCHDLLHDKKEISLDLFLGALSIPMVGSSTIKMIMDAGYDSLEKIQKMSEEQFASVKGIGDVKAKSLFEGIRLNQDLIHRLQEQGLVLKTKIQGKLTGINIAITGSTQMKRADLDKLITDNGGELKSSVGKGVHFLVIADVNSQSTKAVKARSLGTKLISESDLMEMVK